MDKRRLHHLWKKIRAFKPWYFLILMAICGVVCVFALRANNEHMIKLRADVYAADKSGTGVQQSLDKLQQYVTSHMNTNLSAGPNAVYPPIQLKYTYQRLLAQADQGLSTTNSQLYTEAQSYCQTQIPTGFSGRYRVPCIEQYVESHGGGQPTVPSALYEFDFVSPSWSPDLAGWSLVATIVFALLFVVSFSVNRWLKKTVR